MLIMLDPHSITHKPQRTHALTLISFGGRRPTILSKHPKYGLIACGIDVCGMRSRMLPATDDSVRGLPNSVRYQNGNMI